MKYSLIGKVVLITGAAGGIGAASARALYEAGTNLVLTDVSQESVDQLAREFMDNPGPVINSIGVNLTARDVVATISKAVQTNKPSRVHWRVDKFLLKISTTLGAMAPPSITRYTMKKMGGY